jgi:hypothetical protein
MHRPDELTVNATLKGWQGLPWVLLGCAATALDRDASRTCPEWADGLLLGHEENSGYYRGALKKARVIRRAFSRRGIGCLPYVASTALNVWRRLLPTQIDVGQSTLPSNDRSRQS